MFPSLTQQEFSELKVVNHDHSCCRFKCFYFNCVERHDHTRNENDVSNMRNIYHFWLNACSQFWIINYLKTILRWLSSLKCLICFVHFWIGNVTHSLLFPRIEKMCHPKIKWSHRNPEPEKLLSCFHFL